MKARKRSIRIARYVNRYAHIPNVIIGQGVATRGMSYGPPRSAYFRVRRQQKHRFAEGYKLP